jgi:hypothetical protein
MGGFQKTTCSSYFTVASGKTAARHTNFKKKTSSQKWTIWGTFGPKFPGFFTTRSLWPFEGSRRPNRAAVTPIGQQNHIRTPKTVGFARKIDKNTDF